MMRIRFRSILCVFFLYALCMPVFAQERRMPGGSAYFSHKTIATIDSRDKAYTKLNLQIHQLASGNHAKSMAIRAYLYEYCGKVARESMKETNIDSTKYIYTYQFYTYIQTQLYQALQPTVYKLRTILNDDNISFPIVLQHFQSDDKDILYYYRTIPQRYTDTVFFRDIEIVQDGLRRYKAANDTYPADLYDLITYNYIPNTVRLSSKKILYRPFLVGNIVEYTYTIPYVVKKYEPQYIIIYQATHLSNIDIVGSLSELRKRTLLYDIDTWHYIKKTPGYTLSHGVGWKLYISNN